jgi:hypothetical protein
LDPVVLVVVWLKLYPPLKVTDPVSCAPPKSGITPPACQENPTDVESVNCMEEVWTVSVISVKV